jgi:U6 snRNA-associated Sm-like protein LSm2
MAAGLGRANPPTSLLTIHSASRPVTHTTLSPPPPTGRLHSVDQYLNIKLADVRQPASPAASPALASVRNAFIRGSVVRYVVLPPAGVDTELLHDATRREARGAG